MAKSKVIRSNVFEPRPPILPVGDPDPRTLVTLIGQITTTWESTEIAFSYLFGTLVKPATNSPAARRAYGSIISAKSRREMIERAGEVFFHNFPNAALERELTDFMNIYTSAGSRRNDVAHGIIIMGSDPRSGWYLEANTYSSKRDMTFISPFAYTTAQLKEISQKFSHLRSAVDGFRDRLKEHFGSSDPKLRARY